MRMITAFIVIGMLAAVVSARPARADETARSEPARSDETARAKTARADEATRASGR